MRKLICYGASAWLVPLKADDMVSQQQTMMDAPHSIGNLGNWTH